MGLGRNSGLCREGGKYDAQKDQVGDVAQEKKVPATEK